MKVESKNQTTSFTKSKASKKLDFFKRLKKFSINETFSFLPRELLLEKVKDIKQERIWRLYNKMVNEGKSYFITKFSNKTAFGFYVTQFSCDTNFDYIAVGSAKGKVLVYETYSSRRKFMSFLFSEQCHHGKCSAIEFSACNNLIYSGGADGSLKVIKLKTQRITFQSSISTKEITSITENFTESLLFVDNNLYAITKNKNDGSKSFRVICNLGVALGGWRHYALRQRESNDYAIVQGDYFRKPGNCKIFELEYKGKNKTPFYNSEKYSTLSLPKNITTNEISNVIFVDSNNISYLILLARENSKYTIIEPFFLFYQINNDVSLTEDLNENDKKFTLVKTVNIPVDRQGISIYFTKFDDFLIVTKTSLYSFCFNTLETTLIRSLEHTRFSLNGTYTKCRYIVSKNLLCILFSEKDKSEIIFYLD